MSHRVDLTRGPIVRDVALFALPLLLSNLFQQLYNSIDSAVVGSYSGELSLAAVGGTAALINLLVGFFLGIATGTGVLYAMHFGAQDWPGLKKICDAAMLLAAAAGALITVLGIVFAPDMLRWMNTPGDALPEATVYLRIFLAGTVPNLLYNVAAGMIRAQGDSVRPLIYLLISGVLNLLLDLLFVAVPGMGAAGAALATILAQALSCVLALGRMMRLPEEYRFRPGRIRPDRTALADVARISLPCGLQSSMYSIANLLVQIKLNAFGSVAVAGVTAYGKLDGFIYMPLSALSLTASTFVGQNVGAGRYDRVRKGIRVSAAMGFGVVVVISASVVAAFPAAIRLFTDEPEVIEFARREMWHLAPFAVLFVPSDVFGGVMRGAGAATPVMLISALCICVFRIIWLLVILPLAYSIDTVFLCYATSWALSSTVMLLYYLFRSNLRRTLRRAGV